MTFRVVSWNVAYRTGDFVRRQAGFLRNLEPDLVLLQEVNPSSIERLSTEGGLSWLVPAVNLRQPQRDDRPVRKRGVAIGGRGSPPKCPSLITAVDLALPERMLTASVGLDDHVVTALSYHAPPGVNWGIEKVKQAIACADWLSHVNGPVIMGADANTPEHDMPDFKQTRTHWHTGLKKLNGGPGDDILFGPNETHPLTDALRSWLGLHPDEFERISSSHPKGPLALSHRTGRRSSGSPGTDRRFDAIWISPEYVVENIAYPYDRSMPAGSDHSAVVADLSFQGVTNRGP